VATRTLSEADSALLVARYGIPTVESRRAATPALAVVAASQLGFPVVVKLHGERIAHKSDRGLVRVGLRDAAAVEQAATALLAAATPDDGAVDLLVARMATGARELAAGVSRDEHFGPCVMFGVGGVLTEVLADAVFRLAPLDATDAADMIDELRTQDLLGAFRGEPPVDRHALVDVLLGLSRLACDEPQVAAVDLNPLLVDGGAPIAVDALVELEA
jgi:acetate---CoA ligase (ADP-forming) subunit beta